MALNTLLYKALVPAIWDIERAVECALEDWQLDGMGNAKTMSREAFFTSLMELAEVWSRASDATLPAEEAVECDAAWLDSMLSIVTKPSAPSAAWPLAWREPSEVECITQVVAPPTPQTPARTPAPLKKSRTGRGSIAGGLCAGGGPREAAPGTAASAASDGSTAQAAQAAPNASPPLPTNAASSAEVDAEAPSAAPASGSRPSSSTTLGGRARTPPLNLRNLSRGSSGQQSRGGSKPPRPVTPLGGTLLQRADAAGSVAEGEASGDALPAPPNSPTHSPNRLRGVRESREALAEEPIATAVLVAEPAAGEAEQVMAEEAAASAEGTVTVVTADEQPDSRPALMRPDAPDGQEGLVAEAAKVVEAAEADAVAVAAAAAFATGLPSTASASSPGRGVGPSRGAAPQSAGGLGPWAPAGSSPPSPSRSRSTSPPHHRPTWARSPLLDSPPLPAGHVPLAHTRSAATLEVGVGGRSGGRASSRRDASPRKGKGGLLPAISSSSLPTLTDGASGGVGGGGAVGGSAHPVTFMSCAAAHPACEAQSLAQPLPLPTLPPMPIARCSSPADASIHTAAAAQISAVPSLPTGAAALVATAPSRDSAGAPPTTDEASAAAFMQRTEALATAARDAAAARAAAAAARTAGTHAADGGASSPSSRRLPPAAHRPFMQQALPPGGRWEPLSPDRQSTKRAVSAVRGKRPGAAPVGPNFAQLSHVAPPQPLPPSLMPPLNGAAAAHQQPALSEPHANASSAMCGSSGGGDLVASASLPLYAAPSSIELTSREVDRRVRHYQRTHRPTARIVSGLLASIEKYGPTATSTLGVAELQLGSLGIGLPQPGAPLFPKQPPLPEPFESKPRTTTPEQGFRPDVGKLEGVVDQDLKPPPRGPDPASSGDVSPKAPQQVTSSLRARQRRK